MIYGTDLIEGKVFIVMVGKFLKSAALRWQRASNTSDYGNRNRFLG